MLAFMSFKLPLLARIAWFYFFGLLLVIGCIYLVGFIKNKRDERRNDK